MTAMTVRFTANGQPVTIQTHPTRTLLSLLRDDLKLKGAKEACGQGDCGACVVLIDGTPMNACLVLAAQAEGTDILTVEGLEQNGELHPLQRNFIEKWAFQCGYCTGGMLLSAYALLQTNPDPTVQEIKTAVAGNLCRCTGYHEIVEAVEATAGELQAAAGG